MTDAPFEDELIRNLNVRLFRLGLAGSAAIITLAVTVAILALKPRVPPYVIALDHGRIVGYAQPFAGNDDLAPMVIEEGLKQFIYDARVVTSNSAFEQRNIHTVYAMARGDYYIVDRLYSAAALTEGVGTDRQTVHIEALGAR